MSTVFEKAAGSEALLTACGLDSLDAVFRYNGGHLLDKPGLEPWRERRQIAVPRPEREPEILYLKRFHSPPLRRQLGRWLHGHWLAGTASIEWQNARRLASDGIPAAEAVAFGQEMIGPWERRSFVLLRAVQGSSLEKWLPANLPPAKGDANQPLRRERIDRLARLVARFHRQGYIHRDLYLAHIFLEPAESAPDGRLIEGYRLIDLQRVFKPRWRRRRWVVKDLAALDYSTPADRVSRRERLRFLVRYARECDLFGSARALARRVGARVGRMNARRRAKERRHAGPAGGAA